MTAHDRVRISIATARYLEALERDDSTALAALWDLASNDLDLLAAFRETHAGLIEEREREESGRVGDRVEELAERHLTGAEVVSPAAGPATVAAVAEELFRHTPDRLPAAAHALNEKLRAAFEPLPADMGLSAFVAWAEQHYGAAPAAYWMAFREAAVKLELRRAAEVEYQLAARRASKPEDGTP